MKYKCPKCGNVVEDTCTFCSKCGTKLRFPKKEETPVMAVPLTEENTTVSIDKPQYDEVNWKKQYEDLKKNDSNFKTLIEYNLRHALTYVGGALIILIGMIITLSIKTFTIKDTTTSLSILEVYNKIKDGTLAGGLPIDNLNSNATICLVCMIVGFTILGIITIIEFISIFFKKELLREYLVEGANSVIKSFNMRLVMPSASFPICLIFPLISGCIFTSLSITVLNETFYLFESQFPVKLFIAVFVVLLIYVAYMLVATFTWLKKSNQIVKAIKNGKVK